MSNELPDWAKDPDAVLKKRAEDAQRPSFAQGVTLLVCVVVFVVGYVLDTVAWLGGLKAMGWIE